MRFDLLNLFLLFAISGTAFGDILEAEVSGQAYLGIAGHSAEISLNGKTCVLAAEDAPGESDFRIVFICGQSYQVLWDINAPVPEGYAFDEPKFELLWAGDSDHDGMIDIVMEMSPKYSCSRKVTYLSSLAGEGELLGISGSPEAICGD